MVAANIHLVMTSQFYMIFLSEEIMKPIWVLVTPPRATYAQYLLLFRRMNELLLDYFLQQNPVVFDLSHFCCLFERDLHI